MDLISGEVKLIAEGHIASKLQEPIFKHVFISLFVALLGFLRHVAFKNNFFKQSVICDGKTQITQKCLNQEAKSELITASV